MPMSPCHPAERCAAASSIAAALATAGVVTALAVRKLGGRQIGRGTGRRVFSFDNAPHVVLKLARDLLGRAQNEVEARTAGPDTASVHAHAFDYHWIISERVEPLTRAQLLGYGLTPRDLEGVAYSMLDEHGLARVETEQPPFFKAAISLLRRHPQIMPYEFGRVDSWGLRDGTPIILDHGFTYAIQWHRKAFSEGIGGDPMGCQL